MTIVITGATGHLGRLIVDSLLGRGVTPADIVAAGRRIETLDDLAARGVRVARIDYTDPASLDAAFAGAEQVLLVSGSEVGQRIAQHTAAVDAAKRAGVAHLAYTSAPHATTSDLLLAPEHKATEEAIAASGILATILRNGWYTENYVRTLETARQTGEVVASVGGGRVASASREDFADAAAVVLTDPASRGRVYELTGDDAWSFPELAATISAIIGREVVYRDLSPEDHAAELRARGLDDGAAGFAVGLDQNIKAGLLGETSGELSRLIGRPTTPLAQGLAAAAG
jgi:NAD(P)H dehydrogenase (quinone)